MTSEPSAAGTPRGSYAKSVARRRAIVESAAAEFGERGYAGSSLIRIGEPLSMSAAGVLHHFPRKELLLHEVLECLAQSLPQVLDVDCDVPVVMVALAAGALEQPEHLRLLTKLELEAADPAHPAHAWFRDRDRMLRDRLTAVVRRCLKRDRLALSDPDLVAAALAALWRGLRLELLGDPTTDVLPVLRRCSEALAPTRVSSCPGRDHVEM